VRRLLLLGLALAALVALVGLPRGAHAALAPPGLPDTFVKVSQGAGGGTVWRGPIPNTQIHDDRTSAVYLPPGFDLTRRYPVVYLLHGMRGDPSSFYDALHFADVADQLIAAGRMPPFIAVMPVAGPTVHRDSGEWAGVWEDFVVRDVVPWTDAHLPTIATAHGRALAGLCAGGFGAMDIGLRHPGLFRTLESWEGYFAPVYRDGPFVHASRADLAAHTPSSLVQERAAALRRAGVRFYVSVDGNHGTVRGAWSLAFARELAVLDLRHDLVRLPRAVKRHFWSATLPSALVYAGAGFGSG
jgi:Putative esterase